MSGSETGVLPSPRLRTSVGSQGSLGPTAAESELPYLASPEHPQDEYFELKCEEKALGVNINGIEITGLTAGGWGERSGLVLDDEIRAVNGVELGRATKEEKLALFRAARPLTLSIKRPYIKDYYFSLTLDEQGLGLGFKGVVITKVKPDLWAERSGVQVGDHIVDVGGTDFLGLSEAEKIQLFRQARPFQIKFKRPADYKKEAMEKRKREKAEAKMQGNVEEVMNQTVLPISQEQPVTPLVTPLPKPSEEEKAKLEKEFQGLDLFGMCCQCGSAKNNGTDVVINKPREPIGFS